MKPGGLSGGGGGLLEASQRVGARPGGRGRRRLDVVELMCKRDEDERWHVMEGERKSEREAAPGTGVTKADMFRRSDRRCGATLTGVGRVGTMPCAVT